MTSSLRERRRPDVSEVPQLFCSPYWYDGYFHLPSGTFHLEIPAQEGFVIVGVPYVALSTRLNLRVYSALGTAAPSHWIASTGVVVDSEPAALETGFAPAAETGEDALANAGPSAEAAREVRRLSGLPIDQIAALFPDGGAGGTGRMSRENYHRWLSGRTAPSDANLERLLGLQNLLREVAARVDDVRSWLLTPTAALDFEAPYGVLRRGALSRLWGAVSQLPVRDAHPAVTGLEGDRGGRISESIRSTDAGTPADEMDDAADWFDS
jgi:hypothetical protein